MTPAKKSRNAVTASGIFFEHRLTQTMCSKSTSVTVQRLNFSKMQTELYFSLLHMILFFKLLSRFSILR